MRVDLTSTSKVEMFMIDPRLKKNNSKQSRKRINKSESITKHTVQSNNTIIKYKKHHRIIIEFQGKKNY